MPRHHHLSGRRALAVWSYLDMNLFLDGTFEPNTRKMATPYVHFENVHNTTAARELLPMVLDDFPAQSIIDFGTGLGTWLRVAEDLGVRDVLGIDGDWVDAEKLTIAEDQFMRRNLHETLDLGRKFDLAICLEVAEHLMPDKAELLVDNIVRHSDVVLWSAAIEGQGGQNHTNERHPSYWAELFRARGYVWEDPYRHRIWQNEKIDHWYRQNVLIYRKKTAADAPGPADSPNLLVHPVKFYKHLNRIQVMKKQLRTVNSGQNSPRFYFNMFLKSSKIRFLKMLGGKGQ